MAHFFRFTLLLFIMGMACVMTRPAFAQSFRQAEDSLAKIAPLILNAPSDSLRIKANALFSGYLKKILKKPGSFHYPFDQLTTIARLSPADSTFRLFNWNMPLNDGTYSYYGIIQRKTKTDTTQLTTLNDQSFRHIQPCEQTLTAENWHGAHYYSLISLQSEGRSYYTLLGWDGYTSRVTRKVIEVLWFDEEGHAFFGASIFKQYPGLRNPKRVLFKYSAQTTMGLIYEPALELPVAKKGLFGPKTNDFKAIVFDHLMPLYANSEGDYRYYVPEASQFNAFLLKNGVWKYFADIPVKTTDNQQYQTPRKKKIEQGLFPPE